MKRTFAVVFVLSVILVCTTSLSQTSNFPKGMYKVEAVPLVPHHYQEYMSLVTGKNSRLTPPNYLAAPGNVVERGIKFIELPNKVKLEYYEQGDISGIPVIFLHGISDSWHSYELVLPHLPPTIHAFAISLRGHGDSDKPMSGYFTRDFSSDIAAFMDRLQIKSAIIVGHSMGSIVAQRFALDYPQKTKGLFLIGTFANFANNPEVAEFESVVLTLKDPVDTAFAKEFQQSTLVRPIPPEYFNTVVNESLKLPARVWKSIVGGWFEVDYVNELKKFNKPTMILWGEKDSYCPRKDQDILSAAIKGSQLVIYKGTGHAVHWEEPARFSGDLVSFIKKVEKE